LRRLALVATDDGLTSTLDVFAEAVLPHSEHLTASEVAAASGVDLELARRLRRAMGLPDVPEGDAAFFEQDVETLRRVKRLVDHDGLQAGDLLHMARTLGLAAARMAEAVVEFWADWLLEHPGDRDNPAVGTISAQERIDELEHVVGYLFRRHLLDSISRRNAWAEDAEGAAPVAVGFADLVGFTSLSEQLTDRETGELIERFELLATDAIVGGAGRVIKMIGDEVMFAAEATQVGEIALTLAEAFNSPDLPSVRVGVASGSVVAQAGDLYGPVVNLASRATMAARPGTVLISPALAEVLGQDGRYDIHPIRPRRLKGIGAVELMALRWVKATERNGSPTRRAG
jgi:adenylate cyclase